MSRRKKLSFLISAVLLGALALSVGCGPYRIRYQAPGRADSGLTTTRSHAHGLGPIGGGGYFFAVHQMFPAPVDYTGPVDVSSECPNGFTEVSHYHSFGQNAGAAFLSWLTLINVYHESFVEFRHAGDVDERRVDFASDVR